ncbi:MAG: prepilin peptidase [Burkholderiales bacterium]|nr:MAG: prepilin peptidase [Burkholderiales bacterium]
MLSPQGIDAVLAGVLGLLVGSFLNVVVYRLPVMMYREWLRESAGNLAAGDASPTLWALVFGGSKQAPPQLESAAAQAVQALEALPPLGLAGPPSRCGSCGQAIRWYQNIPVFSYLALRGRCAACGTHISLRYPLVEMVCAAFFALCGWRYGLSPVGMVWAAFAALLLCQFLIDLDTQLLPDSLNYMLLWLGLIAALMGWTEVPLHLAVWGAVLGYLSLWTVYHAYRLATGKEGMGYGDFKLLAALGAWLGAHYLVGIILLSSIVGAVLGGVLLISGKLANKDIPISFGPFLAGAGLLCLLLGPAEVARMIPFAFPFGAR